METITMELPQILKLKGKLKIVIHDSKTNPVFINISKKEFKRSFKDKHFKYKVTTHFDCWMTHFIDLF